MMMCRFKFAPFVITVEHSHLHELNLNFGFAYNFKTNRYELIARDSGNSTSESQRAFEWLKTVLQNPNWRKENLPRIRDVVDVNQH